MHDKSKKGERHQRLEQKLIKQKIYDRVAKLNTGSFKVNKTNCLRTEKERTIEKF